MDKRVANKLLRMFGMTNEEIQEGIKRIEDGQYNGGTICPLHY
ncbi:hypothetical protein BAAM0483_08165 [Bifidobacterium animalis subsp. animalis MCC 0483]|uniref:Uncharacterized protein n=1 Tax=Bifidobacterium animalis subsp. animalis MCC 0483 TaxID=1365955 RepID=A0AB34T754_9BIFI|nr:hypothetical protein [Bifidobacterium animalis]KOA48449.1 hypothetical protein BAAM0483_08165 [Bifidobacterium animalis subsp. animalis MCC 0483]